MSLLTTCSTNKAVTTVRVDQGKVLSSLRDFLNTDKGWFISGSYANELVEDPNDIDVYFTDKNLLETVENLVYPNLPIPRVVFSLIAETKRCFTIALNGIPLPIQFIKNTDTYEKIMDGFDLNVCKKIIFPDGSRWEHPSVNESLQIHTVSYDTFSRFMKYYERLNPNVSQYDKTNMCKRLIDAFINDDSIVIDSYTGKEVISTVNEQLFKQFSKYSYEIKEYLIQQALKHSPSLLI